MAVCVLGVLVLNPATFTTPALGAEDSEAAVEAGRKALDRWWDYEWYDDDRDGLRRVAVRRPQPTSQPANQNINVNFGEFYQVLGWIAVVAILVVIAYLLARTYLEHETAALSDVPRAGRSGRQLLDRVEALPEEVRRETSDLLGAARRHVREGNYSEAIIYLFSHLLVLFDQHDLLRLAKGKTNHRYLREVRHSCRERPVIAPAFADVMDAFEDVYYGKHDLPRSRFEVCWSKLPQISEQLARIEQEAIA